MRNDSPATPPGPELYMPYRQHLYHANDLHIVVRAKVISEPPLAKPLPASTPPSL